MGTWYEYNKVRQGKVDFDRTPHTGANWRPLRYSYMPTSYSIFFACSCPIIQYNTIQYLTETTNQSQSIKSSNQIPYIESHPLTKLTHNHQKYLTTVVVEVYTIYIFPSYSYSYSYSDTHNRIFTTEPPSASSIPDTIILHLPHRPRRKNDEACPLLVISTALSFSPSSSTLDTSRHTTRATPLGTVPSPNRMGTRLHLVWATPMQMPPQYEFF